MLWKRSSATEGRGLCNAKEKLQTATSVNDENDDFSAHSTYILSDILALESG